MGSVVIDSLRKNFLITLNTTFLLIFGMLQAYGVETNSQETDISADIPDYELNVQQRTVTGTVTDSKNTPMPGVNVVVTGTNQGTITDMDGKYRIEVQPGNKTLSFSFVGMNSQVVEIGSSVQIYVILTESSVGLDEGVVVGYGTQKKINLTGAVQSVKSEDIVIRNASNTSNALQGLIPGVSVVQSSGRPGGDGATIRIRGTGSLNSSSNPLVLIDGVEGDMNYIDINSIESISILKDGASASIFGSRASNGVILIETKRAREETLKINYNGYSGFNTLTNIPDAVSAVEYMEAINVARANAKMDPQYPESLINDYKTLGADNMTRYESDWINNVIRDRALVYNNSLSISGGTKAIKIYGNAGYYFQDGNIANNDYKRMTLRINTDAQITKWMKIGGDVNIRQSTSKRPSLETAESIIGKAASFVPVFSAINSDGTYVYGQNGDNPIASAEVSGINTSSSPELGLKAFVVLNPVENLDITASYSSRRLETKSDYFIRPYDTYEGGIYKSTYPASGTEKYEGWSQLTTDQFNFQSSYERNISDNFFKILGGIQTEEKKAYAFAAARKGYEFTGFEDINHGDVATATNSGSHWEWAMLSYYGRINYSFRERYLLELNGRWDASSRFMIDYRWGFFPSISAGWRISEENFFESLSNTVNNFKIRLSYGTLGNQEIYSYFPYAATISPGYGYWFNEELGSGVAQTQVANERISWEKSTQMNMGLDADIFSSKLNLTFDYYIRNINDMLQQFPIPLYVGFSSPWENAGSMRNNGWDFICTWRDKAGNINYHVTGTLSDVKNTVTNLYGKEYVGINITREGDPLSSWYGYVSDGFFQSQEEVEQSAVYGDKKNVTPGYIKYKDLSGPDGSPDGVINDYDRAIIGNPAPRFEYSLNMGAEWMNIDFTLLFQGVGKKDLYYGHYGVVPFYIGRTIYRHQLDYWTEDNRDARFPVLLIDGTGNNPNNIISDFWVRSGAYLRLKNLVLGYTLPKSILNKINIDNIRIYASGQNLFTVTNAFEGYDPELSGSGTFYPIMKTVSFGVNIDF